MRCGSAALRSLFPALGQRVHDRPVAYLDTAATALKPTPVIDAVRRVFERDAGSVHRGLHELSRRATDAFEDARAAVSAFVGAVPEEVVFVRGATEALNTVASGYVETWIQPGEAIVLTAVEHHANLLPWQRVCARTGARLVVVPVDGVGRIDLADVEAALVGARVVALAHVSNVLGNALRVRAIADLAHARGALVVVDGAAAAAHVPIDVRALGADFYALSAHKLHGPTGVGMLWGRRELLEDVTPPCVGGGPVLSVDYHEARLGPLPHRLEPGTPPVEAAVGFGAAVRFVSELGVQRIAEHEHALCRRAADGLRRGGGVRFFGAPDAGASQITFVVEGAHAHDVATLLDEDGVAVRAGHLCAQPLVRRLGVPAVVRASFGVYSDEEDVDRLVASVARATSVLRGTT